MKSLFISFIVGILLLMTGCSKPAEVSFDTLEQARSQASENATFNAQIFRGAEHSGWAVISASDSSQTKSCPQGDGWATLSLINPDKTETVSLKCSTASLALGCMLDSTFKTKSFNTDDGHCSTEVPFPLPKIEK